MKKVIITAAGAAGVSLHRTPTKLEIDAPSSEEAARQVMGRRIS